MISCRDINFSSRNVDEVLLEFTELAGGTKLTNTIVTWIQLAILLLCLVYVYGLNKQLKKPVFIHVLWALTSISVLFTVIQYICKFFFNWYHYSYLKTMNLLSIFFGTGASWVFASEYLEVVLKSALIMRIAVNDLARKQKRNNYIQYSLSTIYSLLLIVWLVYSLVLLWQGDQMSAQFWGGQFSVILQLYSVLTIFSACVMIFSVFYLRWQVSRLQETKIVSSRQGLMLVHFVIFTLFVSLSICVSIFQKLFRGRLNTLIDFYESPGPDADPETVGEAGQKMCRAYASYQYTQAAVKCTQIVLLLLYAYMSRQFALPLSGDWKLVYPEYRKAVRYESAARKDADRIIQRIQALVDQPLDESRRSVYVNDSDLDSDYDSQRQSLTSMEQEILEVDRPSSTRYTLRMNQVMKETVLAVDPTAGTNHVSINMEENE